MSIEKQKHWEEIHQAKFQDVSWWQEKSQLWLDLFDGLKLARHSSIIDVGSGASVLLDALLEVGFRDVSALDISAAALGRLKERLAGKIPDESFYVSDVLEFDSGRTFDVWHDRAVFHFLPSVSDQRRYCEAVLRNLGPKGILIISTFSPEVPERCSGLPVVCHDLDSLNRIFAKDFLLIDLQKRVHKTPWGNEQPFNVARFRQAH